MSHNKPYFKTIKFFAKEIVRKLLNLTGIRRKVVGLDYWNERANIHGRRGVLNISHGEEMYGPVTERQKKILFPLLKQEMTGNENFIIDFGCGPGRFTPGLANMVKKGSIGMEPVKYYLSMAPTQENILYLLNDKGTIPVKDESVDIVWICLVLGGITSDKELNNYIQEIKRVLKKEGLIFLVENTSDLKSSKYWKFRSYEFYQELFYFIELRYLSDYSDLNERISIMAGRRRICGKHKKTGI